MMFEMLLEKEEKEMKEEKLRKHYMPIIEMAVQKTKDYYEPQLKAKDEQIADLEAHIERQGERIRYLEKQLQAHYEESH